MADLLPFCSHLDRLRFRLRRDECVLFPPHGLHYSAHRLFPVMELLAFAFSTDGCTSTATSGSCAALGKEIQTCQAAGVKILVSYGGATKFDCGSSGCTGDYYFSSAAQAETTATQVSCAWNLRKWGGAERS